MLLCVGAGYKIQPQYLSVHDLATMQDDDNLFTDVAYWFVLLPTQFVRVTGQTWLLQDIFS